MAYPAKAERNSKMIADYRAGLSRRQVAEKYQLSVKTVNGIFGRNNITLPKEEAVSRWRNARQVYRGGRPPVWPDCPEHLHAEYMRLRKSYQIPAAEARRMLEHLT